MSSLANSSSRRNRAEKHDERLPSHRDGIDLKSPREDSPSSQTGSSADKVQDDMVPNDLSPGFCPSDSHVSTTSPQRSNDAQCPGDGASSGIAAQGCSDQAPHRLPVVHQSRARPLVPAASSPNASVIENQRQRYNRRVSANYVSMGPRATRQIYHSSFPYAMGGRPSNYWLGRPLLENSGQIYVDQRYPGHRGVSAGSSASRLRQPNSLTGINLPAVNQSLNVTSSHPIPEWAHLRLAHSNADLQLHVLSQNPGDSVYFYGIEGLDSPSMCSPQSDWPAYVNRNPILSPMRPATVAMPGNYPPQHESASTEFSMDQAPVIGFGQLQPQPGLSTAPAGYQSENNSHLIQSQPAPSQMDFLNQQSYANSQPQYPRPPFHQTAPSPGFPGRENSPFSLPSHNPAPENNDQMFQHPAQLLVGESNSVGDFIVDVMDSFDYVV